MKARHVLATFLCGSALVALGAVNRSGFTSVPELSASPAPTEVPQRCADRGQPIILVPVFAVTPGQPDSMGVIAADSLRYEIARLMCRQYFPRPKEDMNAILVQSGYPTAKALPPQDIRVLAGYMSADIVVYGTVNAPRMTDWTISPRLMDPSDDKIQEPLNPSKHGRVKFAAGGTLDQLQAAVKVVTEYRKCRGALRGGNFQEAVNAANAALAAYPQSIMARICMVQSLELLKVSPDSILTITDQILASNPNDYYGIRISERAERTKGNKPKADSLLIALLALTPLDVSLQEEVISSFAGAGDYTKAIQFAAQAKQANPGQPDILNLEGTICIAAQKWECAIQAYDEIRQIGDTASQNVQYYERLALAHQRAGNPRQAANVIAQGATKFADTVRLHISHGQYLREAGDTTASITALKKALTLDPSQISIYFQIAANYAKNPDSLLATLAAAAPHAKTNADSVNIVNLVLAPSQTLFGEADKAIKDSTTVTEADWAKFETVIRFTEFADKVIPSDPAKFYNAVSNFHLGNRALQIAYATQAADPQKTCAMATNAYDRLIKAKELILAGGGKASPAAAGQIIGVVDGNQQTMTNLKTTFCKGM